jgi:cysteine desulfurase / selenocysteine lyase
MAVTAGQVKLDARALRADFPIFEQEIHGKPLAYLDSANSSQKPRQVLDAMTTFYETSYSNVHRAVHLLAERATAGLEGAREKVRALLNAQDAREIIFVRNATEALNLVAQGWGRRHVGRDDLVLVTRMEHHSNLVPWQMLGCRLAYVDIDDEGVLDLDGLDALLAQGPKAVAVAHVSNVLGTINPIEEIARRAHAAGAIVVVDGSQAVPHLPVDVAALDADFYAWTGHKAYGPTGIGVLHGRRELLAVTEPLLGGGHMISKVNDFDSTWAEAPAKFEAGTMPIAEAIGLGAAVEFLSGIGMEHVREHARDVVGYAVDRLLEVEGLTLHGPRDIDLRGAVCSFTLDGIHPHDVAEILGRRGVCVRAGHHCAQPLMRRLGAPATTRASFAVHSTRDEVDQLIDGLAAVQEVFA